MDSILSTDPMALTSGPGGRTAGDDAPGPDATAAGSAFTRIFEGASPHAVVRLPFAGAADSEAMEPDAPMLSEVGGRDATGWAEARPDSPLVLFHRSRTDDSSEPFLAKDDADEDSGHAGSDGMALPAISLPAISADSNVTPANLVADVPSAPIGGDAGGPMSSPIARAEAGRTSSDGHSFAGQDLPGEERRPQNAPPLLPGAAAGTAAFVADRLTTETRWETAATPLIPGTLSVPIGAGEPTAEVVQHSGAQTGSTAPTSLQEWARTAPVSGDAAPAGAGSSASPPGIETARAEEVSSALMDAPPPRAPLRAVPPLERSSDTKAMSSPVFTSKSAPEPVGEAPSLAAIGGPAPENGGRMIAADLPGHSSDTAERKPSPAPDAGTEAVRFPESATGSDSAAMPLPLGPTDNLPAMSAEGPPVLSFGPGADPAVAMSKPALTEARPAHSPVLPIAGLAPEWPSQESSTPPDPAVRVQVYVADGTFRPAGFDAAMGDPMRPLTQVSAGTPPLSAAMPHSAFAVQSQTNDMPPTGPLPQPEQPVLSAPGSLPVKGRPASGPGNPVAPGPPQQAEAAQGPSPAAVLSGQASDVLPDDTVSAVPDAAGIAAPSGMADPSANRAAAAYGREAAPMPPAVSHQIIEKIRNAASNDRIEVTLAPADLGKLRLSFHATDGGVSVVINAERPETLDLVRRNADSLARDLRDIGYGQVTFSFGRQDSPDDRRPLPSAPADFTLPGETDAVPEAPPPVSHRSAANGSLDLRI